VTPRSAVVWKDVVLVDEERDDDGAGVDDPAGAAVAQFQRAALDAVRAARALLDAAESVVQDPAVVDTVVRTVTSVARTATEAVSGFASAAGHRTSDAGPDPGAQDDGFEHIDVD
jgi:hypothetical protein